MFTMHGLSLKNNSVVTCVERIIVGSKSSEKGLFTLCDHHYHLLLLQHNIIQYRGGGVGRCLFVGGHHRLHARARTCILNAHCPAPGIANWRKEF